MSSSAEREAPPELRRTTNRMRLAGLETLRVRSRQERVCWPERKSRCVGGETKVSGEPLHSILRVTETPVGGAGSLKETIKFVEPPRAMSCGKSWQLAMEHIRRLPNELRLRSSGLNKVSVPVSEKSRKEENSGFPRPEINR